MTRRKIFSSRILLFLSHAAAKGKIEKKTWRVISVDVEPKLITAEKREKLPRVTATNCV